MRIERSKRSVTLWIGDNHPICKAIFLKVNFDWWKVSRNFPLFFVKSNGAVKGRDAVLDINIRIWIFHIAYTDWSYWRFKTKSIV